MKITNEAVEAAEQAMRGHDCHPVVNPNIPHLARVALEAALPHLTDDGAAAPPADTPGALTPAAAECATTTAAPSSPHLEGATPAIDRDAVVEALWNVRGLGPNTHRNHGYDAFCPVCMSNPYRIADALVEAGLIAGDS